MNGTPSDRTLRGRIAQEISGEPDYLEVSIEAKLSLTVRVRKNNAGEEQRELAKLRAQIAEQIHALCAPLRKNTGLVWFTVGRLS